MTEQEVLDLLKQSGAITEGHFVLSSGRHSDVYVEKFRALERPEAAMRLGAALADSFRGEGIDVVLAPAVGGIILGFATAFALGTRSIFAERQDGSMVLRRGFEILPAERVLVIEDIVTTGKSLKEVIGLVPEDQLAGVGCLLDRSEDGGGVAGLRPLARMDAIAWEPSDCRLCAEGVPAYAPGSRHLV